MSKLKAWVDDLEGVDEQYRDLYAEDRNGGYRLQVETIRGIGLDNVQKLRSEYDSAMGDAKRVGVLEAELERMRERLEQAETGGKKTAKQSADADKLKATVADLEAQLQKAKPQMDQLREVLGESALKQALQSAGASPLLAPSLARHLQIEEDDSGRLTTRVQTGEDQPFLVADNGTHRPGTIEEFVSGYVAKQAEFAPFFADSAASRAPTSAQNSRGRFDGENPSRGQRPGTPRIISFEDSKDFQKMQRAVAEAEKAGVEVQIEGAPWDR